MQTCLVHSLTETYWEATYTNQQKDGIVLLGEGFYCVFVLLSSISRAGCQILPVSTGVQHRHGSPTSHGNQPVTLEATTPGGCSQTNN